MGRYGDRFKRTGATAGAAMGTTAGPAAATTTGNTFAGSAKGGKLRGKFAAAGATLGPVMAVAMAPPLLLELGKKIDQWRESYVDALPGSPQQKSAVNKIIGPVEDFVNPFDKGLIKMPWEARGGTARRGGLAMVGERGPEMIYQPPAASVVPLEHEALRGLGGAGGDIVIHNRFEVDGRRLVEITERVKRAARARS
jgi:hypothetical protein